MFIESYPKIHLYWRIVQAKMFMDEQYHEDINFMHIADEALFKDDSGNWFSLGEIEKWSGL